MVASSCGGATSAFENAPEVHSTMAEEVLNNESYLADQPESDSAQGNAPVPVEVKKEEEIAKVPVGNAISVS